MTRIAIVDPQPAIRAGLAALLRSEPGLVPVGAVGSAEDALALIERARPDVVLLEPRMLAGDGIRLCRRITSGERSAKVVAYTASAEPGLALVMRVAGADGVVDKLSPAPELFEALRLVARGGTSLPPVTPEQLDAAGRRVESDDLALLAMLVDRTPPGDVADALRLDRRRMARRVERLLGRLGPRSGAAAAL